MFLSPDVSSGCFRCFVAFLLLVVGHNAIRIGPASFPRELNREDAMDHIRWKKQIRDD